MNNALPLKCNSRPPKYKPSSVYPTPSASHKAQEPCAKTVYEEREREAETLLTLAAEGFLWELVTLMPWRTEGLSICRCSLDWSSSREGKLMPPCAVQSEVLQMTAVLRQLLSGRQICPQKSSMRPLSNTSTPHSTSTEASSLVLSPAIMGLFQQGTGNVGLSCHKVLKSAMPSLSHCTP